MSSETSTPDVTADARLQAGPPDLSEDQPPCSSAEFGLGGFFPHLDDTELDDEPDRAGPGALDRGGETR